MAARTKKDSTPELPLEQANTLPDALVKEFEEMITHYPDRRSALIPALHRCQEELGGWLSPEILEACAALFELEPVEVYGVASFYPMFFLRPRGEHLVGVCHNISCELRGAPDILQKAKDVTGCTELGGTSPDGKFTVVGVECQGACTAAPMMDVDGTYHEDLTVRDVERILGGLE